MARKRDKSKNTKAPVQTPAAAESTPAPAAETTPVPAAETTPVPVAETIPAPVAETTPAPVAETTPVPAAETTPAPVQKPKRKPKAKSKPKSAETITEHSNEDEEMADATSTQEPQTPAKNSKSRSSKTQDPAAPGLTKAQMAGKEYTRDWFVEEDNTDLNTHYEAVKITSGTKWEQMMADKRERSSIHPKGVWNIQMEACRDKEGYVMSYLGFQDATVFTTWLVRNEQHVSANVQLNHVFLNLRDMNESPLDVQADVLDNVLCRFPLRNEDVTPGVSVSDQKSINFQTTFVLTLYRMMSNNKHRFRDPIDREESHPFFGFTSEDWARAYGVYTLMNKKLTNKFLSTKPSSKPMPIYWGNPHESAVQDNVIMDDNDGEVVLDSLPKNHPFNQSLHLDKNQEFVSRIRGTSKKSDNNEVASKALKCAQNIVTAIITSSTYDRISERRSKEQQNPNRLSLAAQKLFYDTITERLNQKMVKKIDSNVPTLDDLLTQVNTEWIRTGYAANALEDVPLEQQQASDEQSQVKHAQLRSTVEQSHILTSEMKHNWPDFLAVMKELNWDLEDYYKHEKVRVNIKSRPKFGLLAGQIIDIGVINQRLNSPLKGIILGNEPGCGKTFAMFGHILAMAQKAQRDFDAKTSSGPFYPSLIVVPPSLCYQYAEEYMSSFFGVLDLKLWHGSAQFQSRRARNYGEMNSADPKNAARVLVTSYHTWTRRIGAMRSSADDSDLDDAELNDDSIRDNSEDDSDLQERPSQRRRTEGNAANVKTKLRETA
ncbi:MAG: hypothetical protein Q9190_007515 [Brigantiaea leucoxantha]